jgi:hypothetical protein
MLVFPNLGGLQPALPDRCLAGIALQHSGCFDELGPGGAAEMGFRKPTCNAQPKRLSAPRQVRIACSFSALKLKNCSVSNRDSWREKAKKLDLKENQEVARLDALQPVDL